MSWMVYILECADGSLYTGITTDLTHRIKAHEAGKGARYTNGRGPFRLMHQELYKNRAEASRREMAIKSLSRTKKLELIFGITRIVIVKTI
ncbi:MAG: GIY-YIG nuclease family protein [Nitrosomonas sp.]|nr:GIY-YIG nuclease family protein [Nitrosomonas sp.]